MDAIPDATEEDAAAMPNIIFTFHKWMVEGMSKSAGTSRTYARQMIVLFEEDGKSPAGMATQEYFTITKASFKNKSCNGQRSASVKQFMDFWAQHGNKPFEDCKGDKMYQLKVRKVSKAAGLAALSESEGTAERKLRAELELPSTGWSVVVRTRESGDMIAAVSPGGTAYHTREAVDKRLRRIRGGDPPPLSLPPTEASKSAKSASKTPAKEERPAGAGAADEKAASKKQAAVAEVKKESKEEAKKEESKKEEKKAEARKEDAKKAEPKKEEPKKAEAKKEEAKKEEKEEDVKEEDVKEEKDAVADVKEELAKDGDALAELKSEEKGENGLNKEDSKDDILAEMTAMLEESEKKANKKSHKRHRDKDSLEGLLNDAEDAAPADLTVPSVESDTEYPETDVSTCPPKLHVQESGSHKADGTYFRMEGASRGKPCYMKSGERPMYLFWNKKWRIGNEFGSSKNFAMNKDAGLMTPCEPYPHIWKVIDKKDRKEKKEKGADKSKEYIKAMTMRIIDSQVLSLSIESDIPEITVPDEDYRSAKRAKRRMAVTTGGSEGAVEAKDMAVPSGAEKPAAQPAVATNGTAPSNEAPAAEESDEEGDGEDNEVESSQSESSSSSSSEDSGASDSEGEQQGSKEESREVKAPAPKPAALHASEQRAQEFEARLRLELKRMTPEERLLRMQKVKEVLTSKCDSTRVTGMGPEKIHAMLSQLAKDFNIRGVPAAAAKPKPPPLPPPVHLLKRPQEAGGAPGGAPEDHRSLADLAAETQPMTPEGGEPPVGDVDWWRRQRPKRSALRRPGMPRQNHRRITYRDGWLANRVEVASFRHCGEQLWFISPGSYVACDACEKEVSQAMGCLQGAPMQSQFAQNRFLCSDCSGMM